MTVENEFAKRLFAAFASASLLKAEHRQCSAKLRALTESQQIKADLRDGNPGKSKPPLAMTLAIACNAPGLQMDADP